MLRVDLFTGGKWRATKLSLPPFPGPSNPSEEVYQAFLSQSLPELACPCCSAVGKIVSRPEVHESCPACHTGKLTPRASMIP
jgi:hypothetical protein